MSAWAPVRTRPRHREMKLAVEDALTGYWASAAKETAGDIKTACDDYDKVLNSCDQIVLSTFRLLKFLRLEIGGLMYYVEADKIGETCDAACGFYCLGEGQSTSFQEESDVLEILSRAAFREMKATQQAKAALEYEGEYI